MKGNGKERNCENFTTKRLYFGKFEHIHFICYLVHDHFKEIIEIIRQSQVICGIVYLRNHWAFSWKILKFHS